MRGEGIGYSKDMGSEGMWWAQPPKALVTAPCSSELSKPFAVSS